jgi:hypothetical protein
MLPAAYRQFLVAVGLFGAGDFAHTLLILLATQKLIPVFGATNGKGRAEPARKELLDRFGQKVCV